MKKKENEWTQLAQALHDIAGNEIVSSKKNEKWGGEPRRQLLRRARHDLTYAESQYQQGEMSRHRFRDEVKRVEWIIRGCIPGDVELEDDENNRD